MKFNKLSKSKKRKIRQVNKKIGCLFFALLMMLSLVTPAFAEINVDGGSSAVAGSATGKGSYNAADQMWKVTLFYSRIDALNEDKNTQHLGNSRFWKKYGDSIYVYHPTAVRGASGKIKLNYFQEALFVSGNKAEYLYSSGGDISKIKPSFVTYSNASYMHFYSDKTSPALAINGNTIDDVRTYFKNPATLQKMIKEVTKWKKGSWSTANFYSLLDAGNNAIKIDGFNSVDKTANSGKSATTGYKWSSSSYLNASDWVYGVKTDYNGKQIYIFPQISGTSNLNATAWVMVYEPVLLVQPNTYPVIGGKTFEYVACTPTEFAMLDYHLTNSQFSLGSSSTGLKKGVYNILSNSTYLEESWCKISKRSSEFAYNTDLSRIFNEAGIGMTIFDPYNYVIKDYSVAVSAPKAIKTGDVFKLVFTHRNNSEEHKGNTGAHEKPMLIKFVWVLTIKKDGVNYYFDLWDLHGTATNAKTLSISNALKKDGAYVTTYAEAASIVEARRNNSGNDGVKPYNKGKQCYKNAKDSNGNYIDRVSYTYYYKISSEFAGCNVDIRAYTNVDGSGVYSLAQKELSCGAYYKSNQSKDWGNNYARKVVPITDVPEVEPVISVQLNNKTSNEDISLEGKRFAVWCIGGNMASTTNGTLGDYRLLPCTNTSNSGFVGIITTDESGYGEINLADANIGSGQDIYATSNTTADRTATGVSHGYFGSDFTAQGSLFIPGGLSKNNETYYLRNDYWKGNTVLFEHPAHGGVDTSKYTLNSDNTVTNKSTGALVTGFTPSYQIQATKADGYSENSRILRDLGWNNQYLALNGTLSQMFGVMFGGGSSSGGDGKHPLYYNASNKMAFVIRPIDDSYDSTTKYNYNGKEFKVYSYVNENGTAVTTPEDRITFSEILAIYDSSLTGTTVKKGNTKNYWLNTEIANCPIKNGVLTLDGSKVVYEDLITFNLTPSKTEHSVDIDIVEEPGTVTVNYKKGSGCTLSSFQNAQVLLTDSNGKQQTGALNASGTVTFTNVPAGPFSVVPVVKGDTNMDGNLCSCDGSVTQLSTAIDVGCNGSKIQI